MDYIAIGTVYGSHGVRGHVKVGSFSGEFEHFRALQRVQLRNGAQLREFAVEEVRLSERGALLKLAGIETPEDAKGWNRWEIWVPRENACPLNEGEYYSADLHGLRLVCEGEELGTIVSVWDNGASDLLEIEGADGARRVVPFIEQFIGEVNLSERFAELKQRWVLE